MGEIRSKKCEGVGITCESTCGPIERSGDDCGQRVYRPRFRFGSFIGPPVSNP